MNFKIQFNDLWVGDYNNKKSLEFLDIDRNSHIHGYLDINVNNISLPYLGYFGADDVCFNEWYNVLYYLLQDLTNSKIGTYKYDEGEQGQPCFLFEYDENTIHLSIISSEISEAEGDPDWINVAINKSTFINIVNQFINDFDTFCISLNSKYSIKWKDPVLKNRASSI